MRKQSGIDVVRCIDLRKKLWIQSKELLMYSNIQKLLHYDKLYLSGPSENVGQKETKSYNTNK